MIWHFDGDDTDTARPLCGAEGSTTINESRVTCDACRRLLRSLDPADEPAATKIADGRSRAAMRRDLVDGHGAAIALVLEAARKRLAVRETEPAAASLARRAVGAVDPVVERLALNRGGVALASALAAAGVPAGLLDAPTVRAALGAALAAYHGTLEGSLEAWAPSGAGAAA